MTQPHTAPSATLQDSTLPLSRYALLLLATAQFVVVLDASIVNVALPSIQRSLHFTGADLSWVVNGYLLAFGGLLLLGGRVADVIGRRRCFVGALVVFGLVSLACGLAPNSLTLVVFRVLQGAAGAFAAPAALALILVTFTEAKSRSHAFGVYGAVSGAAGAAGVLLGGLLTEYAGWRWVFFINAPITLAVAAAAPKSFGESSAGERSWRQIDQIGAVLGVGGVALLVYASVQTDVHGWSSLRTVGLLLAAVIILCAFLAVELRRREPMLDPRLLANRAVAVGNAIGFLIGATVLASMFFFLSLYCQFVLGYSAQATGLAFLPMAVATAVGARVSALLLHRQGPRLVVALGSAALTGALLWMSTFGPGAGYGRIVVPMTLAGLGLGLAIVAVNGAATQDASARVAGQISAVVTAAQRVGGAVGLAVLASLATTRTADLMGGGVHRYAALASGYDRAFLVAAVLMGVATVLAAIGIRSGRLRSAW